MSAPTLHTPAAMGARTVKVNARLSRTLAEILGINGAEERVRAEVATSVSDLAETLGIPLNATVEVSARDRDGAIGVPALPLALADDIEIRVGGSLCRFPLVVPAYVAAAIDARLPASEQSPTVPWPTGEAGADRLARLVGGVCREAMRRQPSVLIDVSWTASYANALRRSLPTLPDAVTDPAWLIGVLSPILDLGIGIGDHHRVATLLQGCEGLTQLQARETLIAQLARDTIDLLVPDTVTADIGTGDFATPDDLLTFAAEGMFEETGVVFPPIAVYPADGLPSGAFAVRVNDIISMPFFLLGGDECLVNGTPAAVADVEPDARPALIPPGNTSGAIVSAAVASTLESRGYTTWTRAQHVVLQLAVSMRNQVTAFIHQDRVLAQLGAVEASWPTVVRMARAQLVPAELTALLRGLARDRVPLRDLPSILERVADLPTARLGIEKFTIIDDRAEPVEASRTREAEHDGTEAFVRAGLRHQIAQRAGRGRGVINAYVLSDELELLACSALDDEQDQERILRAIRSELSFLPPTASPPVILTSGEARPVLQHLLATVLPEIAVLAHSDLPAAASVIPSGRISL